METLKSVLSYVTPDCFFGSLDIKDAYFSIPVSLDSQGWLAFYWDKKFFCIYSFAERPGNRTSRLYENA